MRVGVLVCLLLVALEAQEQQALDVDGDERDDGPVGDDVDTRDPPGWDAASVAHWVARTSPEDTCGAAALLRSSVDGVALLHSAQDDLRSRGMSSQAAGRVVRSVRALAKRAGLCLEDNDGEATKTAHVRSTQAPVNGRAL
eukprot:m.265430 g.265430  ORF g.265430 m.265430 type:complete len:141 (-) comp19262_c0_seq1:712-1134(-)